MFLSFTIFGQVIIVAGICYSFYIIGKGLYHLFKKFKNISNQKKDEKFINYDSDDNSSFYSIDEIIL